MKVSSEPPFRKKIIRKIPYREIMVMTFFDLHLLFFTHLMGHTTLTGRACGRTHAIDGSGLQRNFKVNFKVTSNKLQITSTLHYVCDLSSGKCSRHLTL